MTDEKILEGFIHSIEKLHPIQADWLLGQRIVELRRDDQENNKPVFWIILENGVKIKLYSISALGIEVTNDRRKT